MLHILSLASWGLRQDACLLADVYMTPCHSPRHRIIGPPSLYHPNPKPIPALVHCCLVNLGLEAAPSTLDFCRGWSQERRGRPNKQASMLYSAHELCFGGSQSHAGGKGSDWEQSLERCARQKQQLKGGHTAEPGP